MTPQERQLVDDLFDRLAKVEGAPRDPDAAAAIQDGLRKAPNAIYALVQTVLLQDEALKRADARIQELEQAPCAGTDPIRRLPRFHARHGVRQGQPAARLGAQRTAAGSEAARSGTRARCCSKRRASGQYDQGHRSTRAMAKAAMDKAAMDKAAASASLWRRRSAAAAARSSARRRQRRPAWSAARC